MRQTLAPYPSRTWTLTAWSIALALLGMAAGTPAASAAGAGPIPITSADDKFCPPRPAAPPNGDGDGDGQGAGGKDDYQYDLNSTNPADTKNGRSIQLSGKNGSQLQEWCMNYKYYALIYKINGEERFIAKCPFNDGKNTPTTYTLNKAGDNLQSTEWRSTDDGAGGLADPRDDDHDGQLDAWVYKYNKATNTLVQEHYENGVLQGDGDAGSPPPTRPTKAKFEFQDLLPKSPRFDNPQQVPPPGQEFGCADGVGGTGHLSLTHEHVVVSYFDFKDGVGIADPNDINNPCTALLWGLRGIQPIAETWEVDQNMGTNLNGPGVGISNLVPPLTSAGGWLPSSGGINLGIPCPIPESSPGNIWLVWSGLNWRSTEHVSATQMEFCRGQEFPSGGPGCLPFTGPNLRLLASACDPATTRFNHHYLDDAGKHVEGQPFDALAMKNHEIVCTASHSHDYTATVEEFGSGFAAQGFDLIKNEAVVHAGSGTTYMAICWSVDYFDFTDPTAPLAKVAQAHDWKLILDLNDPAGTPGLAAALQQHYGGEVPGDGGHGPTTTALRGFYDQSGNNGFGPCVLGLLPEAKKPSPLI